MLQVFNAFQLSSLPTYFTATAIIDRYLIKSYENGRIIGCQNLYLIGIVAVLISSKFEDVQAIRAHSLVKKAGHNRYSLEKILATELEIL